MARSTPFVIGFNVLIAMQLASTPSLRAQHAPPAAPRTDSTAQYAEGCRLLDAGEFDRAVTCLSHAVAARPDDCRYALKLSEAYVRSGRPDAATRLLSNLHASRPDVSEVRVALASALLRAGEPAQAVDLLAPLEPKLDEPALLLLMEALHAADQPARAAVAARDGLRRFPQSEPLWLARIDLSLDHARAALALRTIEDARQAIADSGPLALRAARAYLALGQALGAAEIRTVPAGRVGQVRNGWLLVDTRKREDSFLCCPRASALFELRRAADAGLDTPELHALHARAWQQAGQPARGLKLLKDREATLLETPDIATLRTFLDLALAAGELEQAASYAQRAARQDPQHGDQLLHDAYVRIAEAYSQRGEEPLYAEFLRRAVALQPTDVSLSMRLADAEWSAERRPEAVQIYERLLRDNPNLSGDLTILERLAAAQPGNAAQP